MFGNADIWLEIARVPLYRFLLVIVWLSEAVDERKNTRCLVILRIIGNNTTSWYGGMLVIELPSYIR